MVGTHRRSAVAPSGPVVAGKDPITPRGVATRDRLLEAARSELIERQGVVEVESVARRAEVSVGLIYRHFGSKAGLVGAVVQAFYKRFEQEVMAANPAPGANWVKREHIRTVRAVAFNYEDPLAPIVLSRLHLEPAVAALEARQLDAHIEMSADNVANGQRQGLVPKDIDPRFAGAMVLGGLRRMLVEALAREPRPAQEEVATQLWRFVSAVLGIDESGDSQPVTGAARGIGRVISRVLAEAGARVALADRDVAVNHAAEALQADGHEVVAVCFDVAAPAEVRDGVEHVQREFGAIEVLVNNAGIVDHIAPLTKMSREGWARELEVNLGGAFHLLQAVLPGMVEQRHGRNVLISSVAAAGGLHRQAGYAASKAGLLGLAKSVTLEHARDGITCNAVLPGLIETETVASMPAEIRDATVASTPARRLGAMEEVAHLVSFLASDEAGYINGAEIRIDGGFSLNAGALGSRREVRGSGA